MTLLERVKSFLFSLSSSPTLPTSLSPSQGGNNVNGVFGLKMRVSQMCNCKSCKKCKLKLEKVVQEVKLLKERMKDLKEEINRVRSELRQDCWF